MAPGRWTRQEDRFPRAGLTSSGFLDLSSQGLWLHLNRVYGMSSTKCSAAVKKTEGKREANQSFLLQYRCAENSGRSRSGWEHQFLSKLIRSGIQISNAVTKCRHSRGCIDSGFLDKGWLGELLDWTPSSIFRASLVARNIAAVPLARGPLSALAPQWAGACDWFPDQMSRFHFPPPTHHQQFITEQGSPLYGPLWVDKAVLVDANKLSPFKPALTGRPLPPLKPSLCFWD